MKCLKDLVGKKKKPQNKNTSHKQRDVMNWNPKKQIIEVIGGPERENSTEVIISQIIEKMWMNLLKRLRNLQKGLIKEHTIRHACTPVKLLQLCPTLCNPTEWSPPGTSVHGILQARILEWVAMPSSRGSSRSRDRIHISYISHIGGGFFTQLGKAIQLGVYSF